MSNPMIGEIRMFAGNFAPRGWAFCEGQLLAIAQNTALFSLLGTRYGGNGETTFGLPDLRSRVPIDDGSGPGLTPRVIGQWGGVEQVTLTATELPAHDHDAPATTAAADSTDPTGALPAAGAGSVYQSAAPDATMATSTIGAVGGSQPHPNLMPYLCVRFIIAFTGFYPSES